MAWALHGEGQTPLRSPPCQETQPLRILYHHRIAAADGMRVHVNALVGALRDQGHEVLVVGPVAEQAEQAGDASAFERLAERLRAVLPASAFELLELAYNVAAYARIRREAAAFRPDVLYERYNLFLLAGLRLKRRLGIPMLLEVNSPLASERAEFGNLRLKGLARRCEAALWRGADAVLPVTGVLAQSVAAVRGDRPGLHVVPNGADLKDRPGPDEVRAARETVALPEDALVLGFVGFVRAWHGVGWALDALPDLPERTHLLVVGDGPARPELEARAAELGLSGRVHFTGRVQHDRVAAYTQLFDVALQTASVPYASPLKLFEYMVLGRAIIAPDQPNIREVLTDGTNALLFGPGDAASFRDGLQRLCIDPALRERLGREAHRTIEQTPFTWAANAERIAAIASSSPDQTPTG